MFQKTEPDGTVILRPFNGLPPYESSNSDDVVLCCVVDTETTGVDSTDRVIEVAAQLIAIDTKTWRIIDTLDAYSALQDPGRPIPAEASAVNGISDADVRDQKIDWAHVAELMRLADFCIAHNASFDVPMVDNEMIRARVQIPTTPWGCSLHMLEWDAPSKSLVVLCWLYNFTFSAHRATGDIQALAHLLDISGKFRDLYERTVRPSYLLHARNSPYSSKDWLSRKHFQWMDKCWTKTCYTMDEANQLRNEMSAPVYFPAKNQAVLEAIPPHARFHKVSVGL